MAARILAVVHVCVLLSQQATIGHEDTKLGRCVVGTLMQAEYKDECGTATLPLAMKI